MKAKIIFHVLVVCFLVSCDEPDKNYRLVESSKEDNKTGLEETKNILNKLYANASMVEALGIQMTDEGPTEVVLVTEIGKLFDPEKAKCKIPAKIKNKIKETYSNEWAPKEVVDKIKNLNYKKALLVNTSFVNLLLHTVTVKPQSGEPYEIIASDANTYSKFPLENFINSPRDKFTYSYDCAGFLSAALGTSAKAPAADIKSEAGSSLTSQQSIFIGAAFVFTPIYAAIVGNNPRNLSEFDRVSILMAIKRKLRIDASSGDIIDAPAEYDLMWTSNNGATGFNGQGSFQGSAGGGFGIASISFNAKGDAQFSRSTTFSEYNTYILDRKVETIAQPLTIADLNKSIKVFAGRLIITNPAAIVNNNLVFAITMPESMSDLDWIIKESGFTMISKNFDREKSELTFTIGGSFTNVKLLTLTEGTTGLALERIVSLPK